LRGPATAMRQSIRDSLSPRSARVPRASSFRKATRSRAISTASRSLEAPSEALASSRRRGSSQKALRTFPIRVARGPEATRAREDRRRRVDEFPRRVDVGISSLSYATEQDNVRTPITTTMTKNARRTLCKLVPESTASCDLRRRRGAPVEPLSGRRAGNGGGEDVTLCSAQSDHRIDSCSAGVWTSLITRLGARGRAPGQILHRSS
jgi:hypothetical protein